MAPKTRSQTSSSPSSSAMSRKASSSSSLSSQATTPSPTPTTQSEDKSTILILGTGWAGQTLSTRLSSSHSCPYNLTLLSPTRTNALTPLLASAACSIFDFRMAEEPIRRLSTAGKVKKLQVWVRSVDFERKVAVCVPAVGSNGDERGVKGREGEVGVGDSTGEKEERKEESFEISYDKLVLAPGNETNTFSTPGVERHCLFMRSVKDAMTLREQILDSFELASLPHISSTKQSSLLHFIIIGGGPTGTELAAELDELVHAHLSPLYPGLGEKVKISVVDVQDRVLGAFGEKLSEYAMDKFRRRGVEMLMGRTIQGFEKGVMKTKEDGIIGFGVAVWCAGNKMSALVEGMDVQKTKQGRIMTDRRLRVLKDGEVIEDVYALGDAADIEGVELPTTAEVAVQKARWLAGFLLDGEKEGKFEYEQKSMVAYIGRKDGIVGGKGQDWTGASAWLAWRSGSLEWTKSWRRKAMIVMYWVMNKLDGREIARR